MLECEEQGESMDNKSDPKGKRSKKLEFKDPRCGILKL